MKVDLNNLRKQLVFAHDRLVVKLNSLNVNGRIIIDAEDIQDIMTDLKALIATLAFSYIEGDPDFRELSEIETLATFNPEEERDPHR